MTRKAPLLPVLLAALVAAAPSPAGSAEAPKRPNKSATPAPGEKKLDWLAFDAAAEKALLQNKHMIVDIYTTWCGWCKVMERETYGNPKVADYLTQNFVLAKVNGESSARLHWQGKELTERQFAWTVGVRGYPATFFLKPDAALLGGLPGFIRPNDFMMYAQYVGTRWYEKGKIKDYIDSLKAAPQ